MRVASWLVCILGFSIAAGACNQSSDNGAATGTAGSDSGIASSVERVTQDSGAGGQQGRDDQQGGDEQQARQAELPSTASPLPLAGVIGLLSLGGAIGIRLLRRR